MYTYIHPGVCFRGGSPPVLGHFVISPNITYKLRVIIYDYDCNEAPNKNTHWGSFLLDFLSTWFGPTARGHGMPSILIN